jgi:hypothetical protein
MTTSSDTATGVVEQRGLLSRAYGVVFAPRTAYGAVAARPKVLGALALTIAVAMAASFTFFSTTVGQEAMLDQQVRNAEAFGRPLTDDQYRTLEGMAPYMRWFSVGSQLVVLPGAALVLGGAVFAVFSGALGGSASFRQVVAVVAHAQILIALQQLFVLPIDYAKGSLSSPTSLAVFAPFLDEMSFGARLLGSIDLFWIWTIVNLAIGVGVLYRKRTAPIATTLLGLYAAVALIIATARTAFSGA